MIATQDKKEVIVIMKSQMLIKVRTTVKLKSVQIWVNNSYLFNLELNYVIIEKSQSEIKVCRVNYMSFKINLE